MRKPTLLISAILFFGVAGSSSSPAADPPPIIGGAKARPKPQIPQHKADVVIEWQNILDDCSTEKICVQGGAFNQGLEPAYNTRVRVDIGSHNLSKPRMTKTFPLESTEMAPGDRQEFYFELNRKTPYKNRKGEAKLLEVGKFNFKVVPVWEASPPKQPTGKKPIRR